MLHISLHSLTRRSLLLATASLMGTAAFAEPAHVIITAPAGAKTPAALAETLAGWRQSGNVADVIWLDQNQRDNPGFETFAEVDFPSDKDYQRWAKEDAPKLPAGVEVHHVDQMLHAETSPRDSNFSVFKVDMFEGSSSAAALADYAKHYVQPLMEGQRAARVVMRYTMYQEHQPGGHDKVWLLTEYRDPSAFSRAPSVASTVNAKLVASDPAYAHLDQTGTSLRTAGVSTVSRYTELPPPDLLSLPSYKPDVKLAGTLRIYGSELKNAVEYLARGFQRYQPDVRVTWSNATSSEGAIAGLYTGVSDVAPMGDDAKLTDEMPFYNATGYLPTEISVATGGFERRGSLWAWVIVVNKDNPLNEISVDELKNIFGAERSGGWKQESNNWLYSAEFAKDKASNIRTWDQLGIKGAYKGKEIQTYGFSAPGFQIYFERNWLNWSHKWNPNMLDYVERKEAVAGPMGDAVASERPLEALSKSKYGMAIAGLMHVKDFPNLKILKISEHKGGPYIEFTPQNVANRSYPLKRDAYFYVAKPPSQPLDPKVREFMRFVLSREGQSIIAKVNYYYPLNKDYLEQQLKKLGN